MMDPSISLVYFPSALVLGSLHALEPGHAKTLTAAYLIGIKGTKRDAILLGLSVAATHSVIVIAIAVMALWLGQEAFADQAGKWLQIGSGVIVILLGGWMLWRRWPRKKPTQHHEHGPMAHAGSLASRLAPAEPQEFKAWVDLTRGADGEAIRFTVHEPEHHSELGHHHADMDEEEHIRSHAATMPDYVQQGLRPTAGQIMAFGAAGGMIPCPASITVMLLALSVGKTGWGLLMVLGFSVGLALTLVLVGLVFVMSLGRLGKSERFAWISRNAPLVSAGVVILSGIAALLMSH